jgi:hypothetical protein
MLCDMSGVRLVAGADLRTPERALRISMGSRGAPIAAPIIPQLRTDVWLHEAVCTSH